MRKIELGGEWVAYRGGAKKGIPAVVPGCLHADLLAAGLLDDPLTGRRLAEAAAFAESAWTYERLFACEDLAAFERVVLRFEGVDGGAEIRLNDGLLGRSDNLFEEVEFDVARLLRPGRNRLTVTFAAAAEAARAGVRRQASVEGAAGLPRSPSLGIWRGVAILAYSRARVRDVWIRQDFANAGTVGLEVRVASERFEPERHLEVLVRVCYKGNILHEAREILSRDEVSLHLAIKNPQLWWPAGLGDQPLYEVTVDILDGRACLEHVSKRIGLRRFEAAPDGAGGYRFAVNGAPLFLKGASWLPADLYVARLTRVEYARLVKAAAVANHNVLRVWGGGVYESDAFYDLCDEYGLCVWQDLMAGEAQADVPSEAALAAFGREVRQHVRRLRHHPCLALWCVGDGDGRGPDAAYGRAAAEAAGGLDPERLLLPALPHRPFTLGGEGAAAPLSAFPEPRAVAAYLGEDERNVSHPACARRMTPSDGAQGMFAAFLKRFLMPSGFDNTLWLSQISQALAVKEQVERVRTAEAPPAGLVYWHLNDVWPCCSPSALDAAGRWKALHYFARRFFAPVWVCGRYREPAGTVEVFAFNDGVKAVKAELQWRVTQMDGAGVAEGAKKVSLAAGGRERAASVKVAEALRKCGAGNLLLWLYLLDEQGNQVAWNVVLFCEPRELALQPPRMRAEIRNWDEKSFAVTLTSHHPALWVWIALDGTDARYEDNFFCLEPEKPYRVRVTPVARLKLDQFRQCLRIGSLRDTWIERRHLMPMVAAAKR